MRHLLLLLCTVSFGAVSFAQPNTFDASIIEYTGLRYVCDGTFTPVVKIQNVGSTTMTSCVVETWKNGLLDNSFDWQLAVAAAPGQVRQPALPVVPGVSDGDVLEIRIISVNNEPDQGSDGNNLQVPINEVPAIAETYTVLVEVETADIPTVLGWTITDELAQVVAQGGGYTTVATTESAWVALVPNTCYQVRFQETGTTGFGNALLRVRSNDVDLFSLGGAKSSGVLWNGLVTGLSVGVGDAVMVGSEFAIQPNPTSGTVQLSGLPTRAGASHLELIDASGRSVEQWRLESSSGTAPVVDLTGQAPGTYMLRLRSLDGSNSHARVLITR